MSGSHREELGMGVGLFLPLAEQDVSAEGDKSTQSVSARRECIRPSSPIRLFPNSPAALRLQQH